MFLITKPRTIVNCSEARAFCTGVPESSQLFNKNYVQNEKKNYFWNQQALATAFDLRQKFRIHFLREKVPDFYYTKLGHSCLLQVKTSNITSVIFFVLICLPTKGKV
jgi:hypothetical protein